MSRATKALLSAAPVLSPAVTVPTAGAVEPGSHDTVLQDQAAYPQLDEAEFQQVLIDAAHELEDAGYSHALEERAGEAFAVYALPNGGELGIPMELFSEGERGSGGVAAAGPWVEYTPLEQKMIAGGGIAGVVGGICLIGKATCVIASTLAGAAAIYISERGCAPITNAC